MRWTRRDLGKAGEDAAATYLQRHGANVLARNSRTTLGELDLVMEHDGDLVGVEVKTRRRGQAGLPEEAVGPRKLARLERLVTEYAQKTGRVESGWRIDVVAIEVDASGKVCRLDHIRDAYS